MPLILTDEQVNKYLTPTESIAVMEQVFLARANGRYAGTPRWDLPFENGTMRFTVGGANGVVGFRVYLRGRQMTHDDQLNAVWDQHTGQLKVMVVGEALGVLRTGAIGGVAVKHLAPPNAEVLAIIGTGRQAYSQLRAISSLFPLKEIRVFSRTPAHRESFCADVGELMPHLKIFPVENAELAVRGADIVVGATTSREPVIRGAWLKEGAHVTTLGPKGTTVREIDEEVVRRAGFIVTDSPEQERSSETGSVLDGTNFPLHDLAEVVSGKIQRPAGKISLFLSVGLAGTEVALASRLMDKLPS
ncbi:MAG: ornithine cyclodeaminase family protein [Anaerolineae bacterium]|nr:ornithine cyclodeaminase family protein [Anaerolineae bacterium]